MERVSGNIVEFQMSSLTPATRYTVKVYAVRDLAKSAATTTEFTTGECFLKSTSLLLQDFNLRISILAYKSSYVYSYTLYCVFLLDVDAPYDLAASNILIESGLLTWKPPRADITGYILSFESTDGTVRVSTHRETVARMLQVPGLGPRIEVIDGFSPPRRWC